MQRAAAPVLLRFRSTTIRSYFSISFLLGRIWRYELQSDDHLTFVRNRVVEWFRLKCIITTSHRFHSCQLSHRSKHILLINKSLLRSATAVGKCNIGNRWRLATILILSHADASQNSAVITIGSIGLEDGVFRRKLLLWFMLLLELESSVPEHSNSSDRQLV